MSKSILFIINDFPPPIEGGNIRFLKFLKYLSQLNCRIDVIINKDKIDKNFLIKNNIDKINFHYLPALFFNTKKRELNKSSTTISKINNNYIKNLVIKYIVPDIFIVTWYFRTFKLASSLIKNKEIRNVVCTGPPFSTLLIGCKLKHKYGNKINYIADFRDLWSLSPNFIDGKKSFKFFNRYLEKLVLNSADKTIFVSESIKNFSITNFKLKNINRYFVVNNGFDVEDFTLKNTKYSFTSDIILSYVGSIDGPRCKNLLPEAINIFLNDMNFSKNIVFNFIGKFNINYLNRLDSKCNIYKEIPHEDALDFMLNSDALILILTDDQEGKMAFTGKFFEYLAAQKPILAIVPEGEVSYIINKYNIGICANPNNIIDICNKIEIFISKLRNNQYEKIPQEILFKFSRKEQANELYKLLEN